MSDIPVLTVSAASAANDTTDMSSAPAMYVLRYSTQDPIELAHWLRRASEHPSRLVSIAMASFIGRLPLGEPSGGAHGSTGSANVNFTHPGSCAPVSSKNGVGLYASPSPPERSCSARAPTTSAARRRPPATHTTRFGLAEAADRSEPFPPPHDGSTLLHLARITLRGSFACAIAFLLKNAVAGVLPSPNVTKQSAKLHPGFAPCAVAEHSLSLFMPARAVVAELKCHVTAPSCLCVNESMQHCPRQALTEVVPLVYLESPAGAEFGADPGSRAADRLPAAHAGPLPTRFNRTEPPVGPAYSSRREGPTGGRLAAGVSRGLNLPPAPFLDVTGITAAPICLCLARPSRAPGGGSKENVVGVVHLLHEHNAQSSAIIRFSSNCFLVQTAAWQREVHDAMRIALRHNT